jgi:hypothetical protein
MENSTALTPPDPFNLANLVIGQDYLETASSTKLLTTVRVGKPNKQEWFRIHPDPAFRNNFAILEFKDENLVYIVAPGMTETLQGEIYFATVYFGITRMSVPFLWPVRLPDENGKQHECHRTAAIGAEHAMTKWTRLVHNKAAGAYDIYPALRDPGEPKWPDKPFNELLRIAFRNEGIIDSDEHPAVRKLFGFE